MDDLVQFLRARLNEDEQIAQEVLWEGSGNTASWELPASATVEVGADEFYAGDSTVARHIVRHDPARVLGEVDAKRQALDEVVPAMNAMEDRIDGEWGVGAGGGEYESAKLLRLLALPYASHPDFLEEWRP